VGAEMGKRRGREIPASSTFGRVPWFSSTLDGLDVRRLRALLALGHLELDCLSLGEGAEAIPCDAAEVNEDVLSTFSRDEAVALLVAEPLDGPAQNVSLLPVPREAVSMRWVRPGKQNGRGIPRPPRLA